MLGNTEDEGDLGMIGQDRKLLLTLQDSDFEWLKCVSEAVERIDNGNYGECLSCGRDIDEEMLDAVPWVAFCLRCAKQSRMVQKLKSCRGPIVVIQHSAESLSFAYGSVCHNRCFRPYDQPVVESLMVPLQMVMVDEFSDRFSQRILTKQNHLF